MFLTRLPNGYFFYTISTLILLELYNTIQYVYYLSRRGYSEIIYNNTEQLQRNCNNLNLQTSLKIKLKSILKIYMLKSSRFILFLKLLSDSLL